MSLENALCKVISLTLTLLCLPSGVHHCPSLWAGTNAGHIFVCYLTIPEGEKRTEEEVQVEIGKEIKLKHKAPVVSMFVVDKEGTPLLSDIVEDQGKGNTRTRQEAIFLTGPQYSALTFESGQKVHCIVTIKFSHVWNESIPQFPVSKVMENYLIVIFFQPAMHCIFLKINNSCTNLVCLI